jgi:hypothetical protein
MEIYLNSSLVSPAVPQTTSSLRGKFCETRKLVTGSANGKKPQDESHHSRNSLFPYRFKPFDGPETYITRFTEKVRSNSEMILSQILSWYGVKKDNLPSILDLGYLDFPCLFDWIFENSSNVAEIATAEAQMFQHQRILHSQMTLVF